MQQLMLRDHKLMKIPDVSIFKKLLVFDVTKIEEIDHFYDLRMLELGSNRLRVSSLPS